MDKRPLKVFLCHAHADRDPVRGLYARLTKDGVDAWLDKAKLLPGQDWELEIRKAVREADVVVVCLSKQFNQAGFRQKEVRLALDTAMEKPEGEIFIIPARLEECDNLESLRKWHWVDLFEDDGYEMLMRALRARADRIGTTLQVKRSWLPRITTPRTKYQKPAEIKKTEDIKEKAVQLTDEIPDSEPPPEDDMPPPPDKFPDGWDSEWMPSSDSEKAKSEGAEKVEREATAKSSKTHSSPKRIFNTTSFISVMAIIFCITSVTLIPFLGSLNKKSEPTPTSQIKLTNTVHVISSPSSTLTANEMPSLTPTETVTFTPTPLPTEITDAKGVSMVLVPAGEFIMGSESGFSDERPPHIVSLDDYYIDVYEVTNAAYKQCVDTGICKPPLKLSSYDRQNYYGNPRYDNYPVLFVNWEMANTYCADWRNGRLPTETEWEKAAKGTNAFLYPWGNTFNGEFLNYCDTQCPPKAIEGTAVEKDLVYDDGYSDTSPVGSFPDGVSPYGVYDMAGNVWEWVFDWYGEYDSASSDNPLGPMTGEYRILRGGSWASDKNLIRVTNRRHLVSEVVSSLPGYIGFRCATDAIR